MEGQFNARISRLERLQDSATEVPKPTAADAGKVITVNQDGDGYELTEGGGGGGGIQIIRPLKIKDLPPVPSGLTPSSTAYDMTNPEADAPCYFDNYVRTMVAVEESGENIQYIPSYLIYEDSDVLFLQPATLVNMTPPAEPATDGNSDECVITAEPLSFGIVQESDMQNPVIPIDIATIQWVRLNN